MTVSIDKFWIEGVLTKVYPNFVKDGGADLDENGRIEGKEVFKDLDQNGTVGDRDDYKEYLRQNRPSLSRKIPFFKWGKKLSVDNRIHQGIYWLSDLHSDTQIASAYAFIAGLVNNVGKRIGRRKLGQKRETQIYYRTMRGTGILFSDLSLSDDSLVTNIGEKQFDCDTSSFIAMAIGDERNVVLHPVRSPTHVFVRGGEGKSEFNVDGGKEIPDSKYNVSPDLVAKEVYLKTLSDHQLESLFLENRGLVLAKLGRFEEALVAFDRSIEVDQNYADAHYNRGRVLEELFRYEDALLAYKRSIALDPNLADVHHHCGDVLRVLGRYPEALKALKQAIEIEPGDPSAHISLYHILSDMGQGQEALKALNRACTLMPFFAECRR